MKDATPKIDGLCAVTLDVRAGTRPESVDLKEVPETLEWITGIGVEGFTPFEYELIGREKGDSLTLTVDPENAGSFFGHLPVPAFEGGFPTGRFFLQVHVTDVRAAESSEVVKAMAANAACGGACCGHH
jgi:hypothetical protein